jgi:DNA modification methylase
MKPIKLVIKAIKASSLVGGGVLDLFGGSGTTLIACEQTNRKCYMSELDPKYVDVIIDRWQQFTGKEAIRDDGKKWNDIKVQGV